MNYPHLQPFNTKLRNTKSFEPNRGPNLNSRIEDYHRMCAQSKIGDGHRDANGYTCPGSNKK